MAGLSLREEFVNITDFRKGLADFQERSRWDEVKDALPVEIVTDHGKPMAAVMPYRGYEALREIIFILKARASAEAGAFAISGKTADDVIEALKERVARRAHAKGPRPAP